jgi:acyl-coenzyme A synthetase/AMP-(fatty) acid ligase
MRDEVPVAFVVAASPGPALERAIMLACESKLSAFKRPREIYFINELPTGLLGKVLKRDLRERVRQAMQ